MYRRTLITLAALAALAALTSTAGAQGNTVTVMASEYSFQAPDSIPAGMTTFRLLNSGSELHHVQIVRLEQGKTFDDFAAAVRNPGPPPAWLTFLGGPNTGIPDGKTPVTVTVNLPAGNYAMVCFIPGPDGAPHIAMGMMRPLTVTPTTAAATQASAPRADAVMTLYDYNFDLDKPLTAGRRTILVKNKAAQFHEAVLVKLPPGVPATAFLEWLGAGMQGPPPVIPMGGVVGITAGEENYFTVDLEPGNYGLYCFLPDAKDGKEHAQHGMFKQIVVAK